MPHPASGQDVDIPDCVDDAVTYPDGGVHQPSPDYGPSDYSDAPSIPDVAGETREIAERS
jgi:hypothetical protein